MSIFTGITIVKVLFLLTIVRLVYEVCIRLFLQTQPADSNNGFKKVILCE